MKILNTPLIFNINKNNSHKYISRPSFGTSEDTFERREISSERQRETDLIKKFAQNGTPVSQIYPQIDYLKNYIKDIFNDDKNYTTICNLADLGVAPNFAIEMCNNFNNYPYLKEKFLNYRNEAIERNLPNLNHKAQRINYVDEYMVTNFDELRTADALLGEKGVIYAFNMKDERFDELIKNLHKLNSTATARLLMEKTNPTQSVKYKELDNELQKNREELYLNIATPEFRKKYEINTEEISKLKKQISDLKQNPTSENKAEIKKNTAEINRLKAEILAEKTPEHLEKEIEISKIKAQMNEMIDKRIKDPQDIIKAARLVYAFDCPALGNHKTQQQLFELLKFETPKDRENLNNFLDKHIFNVFGNSINYNNGISTKLKLYENRYLPELFSANEEFTEYFGDLLNIIYAQPDKSVRDILNELPQNKETKAIFEKNGIDYDKWVDFDKNSFISVDIETDIDASKMAAIENFKNDMLNLNSDNFFPKHVEKQIKKALEQNGFTIQTKRTPRYDADGYTTGINETEELCYKKHPINFNELIKAHEIVQNTLIHPCEGEEDDRAKTAAKVRFSTFYDHIINLRANEIKKIQTMKEKSVNLKIQKTDMNNIGHALFLGNHAGCCTAVGSGVNQFTAPTYIKNKLVAAIEVLDGKNFIGNTMCYIANVDDEPSLILDNIELTAEYQNNDRIRDAIIEYAEKLTEEIGKPDMPIYAGIYRHKCDMKIFDNNEHTIKLIGSSGEDSIYMDFTANSNHVNSDSDSDTDTVFLFKIK